MKRFERAAEKSEALSSGKALSRACSPRGNCQSHEYPWVQAPQAMVAKATIPILSEWKIRRVKGKKKRKRKNQTHMPRLVYPIENLRTPRSAGSCKQLGGALMQLPESARGREPQPDHQADGGPNTGGCASRPASCARPPVLALTQYNYLTLKGSFSAVSKPNFASEYALE